MRKYEVSREIYNPCAGIYIAFPKKGKIYILCYIINFYISS